MVHNSNGTKFVNLMAFGYQTVYYGCKSNGQDHSISNYLKTEQVKVCYSDRSVIQMFAIQIPSVVVFKRGLLLKTVFLKCSRKLQPITTLKFGVLISSLFWAINFNSCKCPHQVLMI